MKEKGNISINTENIFPIIKKFLYSDQDIFLRELVSNAVDATQKVKSLSQMGELKEELGDLTIEIILDEKKKTITVSDKGIGMSGEEIKKYIHSIFLQNNRNPYLNLNQILIAISQEAKKINDKVNFSF